MNVQHQDLFPTRLWIFDIPELVPYHASWLAQVLRWRDNAPNAAGRSNRKGWNSEKTVFDQAIFNPLKSAANTAFAHAFSQMQLTDDLTFGLEAWANLHDTGGFNMLHTHPNVLLSASYYLQVPEVAGPIVFRDPRPGVQLVSFAGNGIHCQRAKVLYPKAGQLVMFPNWLEHHVEPNEALEPRVSIAMNAILDNYTCPPSP